MDLLTLSMAKQYSDSQRLGYTETVKKTITWDGNTEGKEIVDPWIKVSDVPIEVTADNFSRAVLTDGEQMIDCTNCIFEYSDGDRCIVLAYPDTEPPETAMEVALIAKNEDPGFDPGVYFWNTFDDDKCRWALLETEEEVIHKVDPKFIPGLIPVLKLTTEFDISGAETPCNAEESAILQMAADNKMPIVVQFNLEDNFVSMFFCFDETEETCMFSTSFAGLVLSISNFSGKWTTHIEGYDE